MNGMKIFVRLALCMACVSAVSSALCMDYGWGGCSDRGCYASGGYCKNYGCPPNNDCRCITRCNHLIGSSHPMINENVTANSMEHCVSVSDVAEIRWPTHSTESEMENGHIGPCFQYKSQ